jgi:hypothetical protein
MITNCKTCGKSIKLDYPYKSERTGKIKHYPHKIKAQKKHYEDILKYIWKETFYDKYITGEYYYKQGCSSFSGKCEICGTMNYKFSYYTDPVESYGHEYCHVNIDNKISLPSTQPPFFEFSNAWFGIRWLMKRLYIDNDIRKLNQLNLFR